MRQYKNNKKTFNAGLYMDSFVFLIIMCPQVQWVSKTFLIRLNRWGNWWTWIGYTKTKIKLLEEKSVIKKKKRSIHVTICKMFNVKLPFVFNKYERKSFLHIKTYLGRYLLLSRLPFVLCFWKKINSWFKEEKNRANVITFQQYKVERRKKNSQKEAACIWQIV